MQIYQILETLTPVDLDTALNGAAPWCMVLSPEAWHSVQERIGMGIDMDGSADADAPITMTGVTVNFDSLTGSFFIPRRRNLTEEHDSFALALDERGVVFIDQSGLCDALIRRIAKSKKWRFPGLERFLYDFLECVIADDLQYLGRAENTLKRLEDALLSGKEENITQPINDLRGELLDLRTHYEQLIDVGHELEENENNFFQENNLRYFRLFTQRVERLQEVVRSLRDYTVQVRDLQKAQMDAKQNRIMTLLTVISGIFMPLTLIVGWYGMNFANMPELKWKYGYPVTAGVSLLIVILCLWYFKRKKWL